MALVWGNNCGFVAVAPVDDPGGTAYTADGRAWAQKADAPAGAVRVTEIGWWCDNEGGAGNYEVGIYDHDAVNDRPLNLLAGAARINALSGAPGWQVASGLNIIIEEGVTYWIGWQIDDTDPGTNFVYSGIGYRSGYKSAQTTLPDPFGSFTAVNNTNTEAIYAVYETAGGVSPTAALGGPLVGPMGGPI